MNDILARRARRATVGIALSAALVAGIAPVAAIAAETSSPTGAVALQTAAANSSETAATEKDKAYAAMQEALKTSRPQKTPQVPRKLRKSILKLPFFKRTTTLIWRELPYIRNPFLPCKRTSMQPNPNAIRPTTEQETLRQN